MVPTSPIVSGVEVAVIVPTPGRKVTSSEAET